MPEQLAVDLAWLGGGATFAWLICAIAQVSALVPGKRRRERRPSCCPHDATHKSRVAVALSFALFLTVPAGLIAAGSAHAASATIAVEIGVMTGLVCASGRDFTARTRAVALCGCALGAVLAGGAFFAFLWRTELAAPARLACFAAVATGAMSMGGALGAFAHRARMLRATRIPFGGFDRLVHAVALALVAVLGFGFVVLRAAPEFGVSGLIAAALLCAALGARLMSGAYKSPGARLRSPPRPFRELFRSAFQASFAGVSDERLVAACVGGTFEPAWIDSGGDLHGAETRSHQHALRNLPRRRHNRRGALRQRQGPH